jgi:hypothetical protein
MLGWGDEGNGPGQRTSFPFSSYCVAFWDVPEGPAIAQEGMRM